MNISKRVKTAFIGIGCVLLNFAYLVYLIRLATIDDALLEVTRTHMTLQANKMFMILMSLGIVFVTLGFSELKRNIATVTGIYFLGIGTIFILDYFFDFIVQTEYPIYILSLTSLLCLCYLLFLPRRKSN